MQIEIFDVGHGHCTVITAPNGRRMMLDCGQRWDDRTFWTPSLHYFNQTIDLLALLNLDEDHVRDFDSVMRNCTVPWMARRVFLSRSTKSWRDDEPLEPQARRSLITDSL
jgi:beta-lactamase superfamily II metal-dependent hydrolase